MLWVMLLPEKQDASKGCRLLQSASDKLEVKGWGNRRIKGLGSLMEWLNPQVNLMTACLYFSYKGNKYHISHYWEILA